MLAGMSESETGTKSAAAEIEVTDEMIEAGFEVFEASGIAEYPSDPDKLTLAEIYRAMFRRSNAHRAWAELPAKCCNDLKEKDISL